MKKTENVNYKEKVNEILEKLFEELKNGYSENFKEFIRLASKFSKYSLNNLLLIYSQCPSASKIAGFKKWSELGFKVKKGSKAIKILAPREYKYIEKDNKIINYKEMTTEEKKNTSSHKKKIYFSYVNVFDLSQVDGDKEKLTFFKKLGNDNKEIYEKLKLEIEKLGIEVVETEETRGAEGISKGGTILINIDNDYNNKFLTLIHELAHEKLDQGENSDRDKTNRQIRELRAETVSYIVANYFNIENPFTSDYIQNHGNSTDDLKEHLEKILKCSSEIINLLDTDD